MLAPGLAVINLSWFLMTHSWGRSLLAAGNRVSVWFPHSANFTPTYFFDFSWRSRLLSLFLSLMSSVCTHKKHDFDPVCHIFHVTFSTLVIKHIQLERAFFVSERASLLSVTRGHFKCWPLAPGCKFWYVPESGAQTLSVPLISSVWQKNATRFLHL